jgi:hypothetical protein
VIALSYFRPERHIMTHGEARKTGENGMAR